MNTMRLRRMLLGRPLLALIVALGYGSGMDDVPRPGESRAFDGMQFVWVPPGEFEMGSRSEHSDDDEQPVTRVEIRAGYWLGKYEVSQGEWERVMGSNPSEFQECGSECPVESVSSEAVQEFIWRLNERGGGTGYRLPSEAEWEFAARAGSQTDTYAGDITEPYGEDPVLEGIAWYENNTDARTQPVGGKEANAWGLHDMLGNVWEWVGDWYGEYPGGRVTDPTGPGTGSGRVMRGGGWNSLARICRAANRGGDGPGIRVISLGFIRSSNLGFRLARTQ